MDVEVLNVLRRQTLHGILAKERCATALQDLENIKMTRYPHVPLLERIWDLRENVTVYDAAYIALAEALEAPLVTRDARLAQAPASDTFMLYSYSSETIFLALGMDGALMLSSVTPSSMSFGIRAGSPAASPHTPTQIPAFRAASQVCSMRSRTAG